MRFLLLSASIMMMAACAKKDTATSGSSTTAEMAAVTKAQTATAATATNSNGLTKGTGFVVAGTPGKAAAMTNFTAETDCAASGWPAAGSSSDVGYAMKFLMCSVLKRPDGPDTVRGGFDRLTGFLCALGTIPYDGATHTKDISLSTACFSQSFVTMACTYILGSASTGPCTASVDYSGHDDVTGVAPASFEKYVTVNALGGEVMYTIAFKNTATTSSGAMMEGLPATADASVEGAFAYHIDSATGTLRYEGRFPGTNKRHMRINLIGTINTSMAVTNVDTLSFVQGENFGNNSGLIVSVHGTPSAGRRIRVETTSDLNNGTPTWGAANADDNTCVGEAGVLCTSNTGIQATDRKFFFYTGTGFTSSKTWFTANSYLGSVSNTVDMDDLWD